MFNKQDLEKHIPDGKSAKDDFATILVPYFIVSSYQCSIWGARKDWWAYQIRVNVECTKHNKEATLCLLLICFPKAEQNKTKQLPLWVFPDTKKEQAWYLQRCTSSQLECLLVGLGLKHCSVSTEVIIPAAFAARVMLFLHRPVYVVGLWELSLFSCLLMSRLLCQTLCNIELLELVLILLSVHPCPPPFSFIFRVSIQGRHWGPWATLALIN